VIGVDLQGHGRTPLGDREISLAILPNLTHYEMGVAPQLVATALPFLDAKD